MILLPSLKNFFELYTLQKWEAKDKANYKAVNEGAVHYLRGGGGGGVRLKKIKVLL